MRGFGEVTPFYSQAEAVVLFLKMLLDILSVFAWSLRTPISFVNPSFRGSVCPSVTARFPLDGVPQSFVLGVYMKVCRETPNFIEIGRKIGHFTSRPRLVCIVAGGKFATIFFSALSVFISLVVTST